MHRKVATLEPSESFLESLLEPFNGNRISQDLLSELALPWTCAIQEYVDSNENDIKTRYIQNNLSSYRGAKDSSLIQRVQYEADNFFENILPQKMLDLVNLDQAGYRMYINKHSNDINIDDYERWVNVRLNPVKLDSLVDMAMNSVVSKAASMLAIAARVARVNLE